MHERIGKSEDFKHILERFDEGFHPWIDAGYGWAELINKCHEKLVSFDPTYKVVQVKEKFGGLRYYFNPSNPVHTRAMHDMISQFERNSYSVCEVCGENAKLRKTIESSWFKTLCEEHSHKDVYQDVASENPYQQNKDQLQKADRLTLYPIAIRESRYSGAYEGGKWHAIPNCNGGEVWNMEYFDYLHGDDESAISFWIDSDAAKKIGVGETPNDALADLFKKSFI